MFNIARTGVALLVLPGALAGALATPTPAAAQWPTDISQPGLLWTPGYWAAEAEPGSGSTLLRRYRRKAERDCGFE